MESSFESTAEPGSDTAGHLHRVLIVEDHPDNRKLLMDYFEGEFELRDAGDGTEGLRIIREWRPDAVLLDISLPGLDGFEVARQVQEDPATCHIPVIAMTAHAMEGDRGKILRKGFAAYVAKPFRLEVLRQTLHSVLEAAVSHGKGNRT